MFTKQFTIIVAVVVFILSTAATYTITTLTASGTTVAAKPTPEVEPSMNPAEVAGPKTAVCPLNGVKYTEAQRKRWETRRPLGIMVENSLDARPQSGISTADVVYETVAEGGITRFLLMYYCQDAKTIGPVRSARIYFMRLLQGYGEYPLYAHVGGANTPGPANALGEIGTLGWNNYNDLSQFSVPFPNFWRDYERLPNVATEHTMYTDSSKLWSFAKTERDLTNVDKKKTPWNKDFEPWTFADDAAGGKRGKVSTISFGFWDTNEGDYGVTWKYNKETNEYLRTNGGNPHNDKNTGKQIAAKNVVIMFAQESPANDGYSGGHLLYDVVGDGDAIVYQNGQEIEAVWEKPTATSQVVFSDASTNKEIPLVRGQIFVHVLDIGNKVTAK